MPNSFKDQFHIYWSSRQHDKHKGSGMALICLRKWDKHYQGYNLFRNVMFSIQTVYAVPQDKTILYDILEKLLREMCDEKMQKISNNIVHILMRDFNLISNGQINHSPSQHISKPKFFNNLEAMTYRLIQETQ